MKTLQIGTFEAKNRLSELLDEVGRGRRVIITRRGKRVAVLAPPDDAQTEPASRKPSEVLASFRELRKASLPGRQSLKALIEEGRR